METDQLGIWIHTRVLLKQFNDEQLNQNSQILQFILNMFGGWKNVLLFILNNKDNFRFDQLHQLRDIILESQQKNNIIINYDNNNPLHLLNMNNNLLTNIYQYLPNLEHIRLSKTCTHLFTIGRSHASFPSVKAAYKIGIIPGLSRCLISFDKQNGMASMDNLIKYIKFDCKDQYHYDLCPVATSGIFNDLIEISQITDDIDIRNQQDYAIKAERRKYFVFHVMKSVADDLAIKDRDLMIDHFEIKQIAYEYCIGYRQNNPPKCTRLLNIDDDEKRDQRSDPYYQNAQVALYLYMMLAEWNEAQDFGKEMEEYIKPIHLSHVNQRFAWQDPALIIEFERMKNKDLEQQLDEMNRLCVQVIDSKTKLAEKCAAEMNRCCNVINGLLRIPHLTESVELLMSSARIESLRIKL